MPWSHTTAQISILTSNMASPSVARINLSQIHAFAQSYRQIALAPQRSAAAAAAAVGSRHFLLAPSGLPARVREFQSNLGGASATLPSVRALTELFNSKTKDAVQASTPQVRIQCRIVAPDAIRPFIHIFVTAGL
jgi:hypothetical protein